MAKAKTRTKTRIVTTKAKGTHPKATLITWIVIAALAAGLIGGYMVAKAKYIHKIGIISEMFSEKDSQLNDMKMRMGKMNKVMKADDKMFVMKDGEVMAMKEDILLSDGTLVTKNGRYTKPGQPSMMFENGEAMDMDGNMISEDEDKVEF